jgi:UDP-3-O-[3-hydroxymyristoyl] N-acetylglucosamine deacetylase/3-hydroxyacyl-[acyl-carrier-protein] dehydratase
MASTPELQQTLAKPASFSGTALHTGEKVALKLQPAPVDHGIKFKRKDLQDEPTIDAKIENLKTVERATTIGEGSVRVHTVEHVLAALWAMGVDNAVVEMDANEPPIGDGSAQGYVDLIRKAGVTPQDEPRKFFDVRETVHVESKTGALLVLLPDEKFRISCTQAGPNNRFAQFLSMEVTPAVFEREIAPARTFVFYEDVQPLMEKNLIKGGSLENAIVVRGEAVLSKEPLRFADEFVRHKILDIIGDLALVGRRIRGHVVTVKPGHAANADLARAEKRDERTARDPQKRFRSRHWRSDEDPPAPLPFFDG